MEETVTLDLQFLSYDSAALTASAKAQISKYSSVPNKRECWLQKFFSYFPPDLPLFTTKNEQEDTPF